MATVEPGVTIEMLETAKKRILSGKVIMLVFTDGVREIHIRCKPALEVKTVVAALNKDGWNCSRLTTKEGVPMLPERPVALYGETVFCK